MNKNTSPTDRFWRSPALPYIIGATTLGVCAAIPAAAAWFFVHPLRVLNKTNPRAMLGLDYHRVRFTSADGTRIRAWYIPAPVHTPPRGLIVVCHGYTGNRATMLPYVEFLHKAGYATLLPEFRAHGWSGGSKTSFGIGESLDLQAGLAWVREQDNLRDLPLVLMGESMGASVVLLVAAEDQEVRAVIADSPYACFDVAVEGRFTSLLGDKVGAKVAPSVRRIGERMLGIRSEDISPEKAIVRIAPRPVMLVQGLSDRLIHPDNAYRLMAAAPGNATLWEVPGANHVCSIYLESEEYARRATDFLTQALG